MSRSDRIRPGAGSLRRIRRAISLPDSIASDAIRRKRHWAKRSVLPAAGRHSARLS